MHKLGCAALHHEAHSRGVQLPRMPAGFCLSDGMCTAAEDDDDDKPVLGKAGAGRSSTKLKSKTAAAAKTSKRPSVGGFAAFRKRASKVLLGWLDPRFRRNGKKLVPSNTILWKFMVGGGLQCFLTQHPCSH